MPRPARFTIRAASALTGINQNTLRAWERRHALIRPERTPKGYRLYSDEDIERLRRIQSLLQSGISIGRVRDYLDGPLVVRHPARKGQSHSAARGTRVVEVSLAGAGLNGTTTIRLPASAPPSDAQPSVDSFAQQIVQASRRLDRVGLERAFGRAVGLYSLRKAFHHVLAPALSRVAQEGREEQEDGAAERFLAAFAREKLLGALAGLRPLHQQPRALFACSSDEPHEIALMLVSLEVGLEGVSAQYLGAGATNESIERTAESTGSRAVALLATRAVPTDAVLDLRDRLASLQRRPRLLLAGSAAERNRGWIEANGLELLSLDPREGGTQVLRAIGQA